MILQNMIFPKVGVCSEEELYFKNLFGHCQYSEMNQQLNLYPHTKVTFYAYFNIFSLSKWATYTFAENFRWVISYSGKMRVVLYRETLVDTSTCGTMVQEIDLSSDEKATAMLDIPYGEQENTVYYLSLESQDSSATFYGGYVEADADPQECNDVTIALNICTRHREAYVRHTLQILQEEVWSNEESFLKDHLVAFITDNGQTMDPTEFKSEHVLLTTQNGYGSAGGYTRGLIEILRHREQFGITHFIYTDDDIVYHTEALQRTFMLLKLVKAEYAEAVVGGAIFRLDYPFVQHEAGARWNRGHLKSLKAGYDMRDSGRVLRNEVIEQSDFSGWWYCCVPLSLEEKIGLPAPVYFHRDDVEYGMRSPNQIYLNGICVWHEPFDFKPGSHIKYYDTRNFAIVNAWHCDDFSSRELRGFFRHTFLREITQYRYTDAQMVLLAMNDWSKGVDWLLSQNTSKKFDLLFSKNYKQIPVELGGKWLDYIGFLNRLMMAPESKKQKLKRCLQLNGLLLPAKYNVTVPMYEPQTRWFYRAKQVINYNPVNECFYLSHKEYGTILRLAVTYIWLSMKVGVRFRSVVREWRDRKQELTSMEFWQRTLDLHE